MKILVFSEDTTAVPELCSGANTLGKCTAVLLGNRVDAEAAAKYAAKVIYLGQKADDAMVEDYVPALAEIVKEEAPQLILLQTSRRARCIAGRLCVLVDGMVCPDAISVGVEADCLVGSRMVFGGVAATRVRSTGGPMIALVSAGSYDVSERGEASEFVERPVLPLSQGVRMVKTEPKQEERVNLTAAKRIIGVGRGIGSPENIALAEQLGEKIGAELGCSRPVAEGEHWMAANRYIGVSGQTVKPDIYLAVGISGQVQHMVGINKSKTIFAINKDKAAPIFAKCDYGIVGDAMKILPELIAKL